MTLPTNYADGDYIHGSDIDSWTAAINANTNNITTLQSRLPTGTVVGTTDTQTLTHKTLTDATNVFPTFNQNTTGTAAGITGKTTPSGALVGTTDAQALTNKDLTGAGNTFPTFNQNTTGNAATATALQTGRSIQTNLASTTPATFNGTIGVTPGITGTLGIGNGGTGATTAAAALTNLTAVGGSNNGTPTSLTLWIGTAAQYAAIGTKDSNTVYIVTA